MKLSSHSVVAIRAIRAAALVLLLGAALPLAAQTAIGGVDTIPPTIPTGLVGTAVSANQIRLSWNPSTDDVGVTGYIVRRNGVQIVTPSTTTGFADIGLSTATTYTYTVAARDAAGNISPNSTSVSVTNGSVADTTPPSARNSLA